jgi:hypothetical protein
VLETRVFSLSIFTNDAKIDVIVASFVSRDVFDKDDGCVDVEFLSQGDVERLVAGALDRSVENTLAMSNGVP